ncbi:MAG: 4Fe-4S dicluster domain-containing protein [Lachnospiraceae bacterium]|nr:4Fe-4S dicluster domain-containing protein [Lachnospiraceae bacterium]
MQKVTRDILVNKAKELLANGTVDRVYGWKKGEFAYDVTPALFKSEKELDEFVFGDFCGANVSKYLVAESKKAGGKILVFLKPCDTYSLNQLTTEHRVDREKIYAVGIPCEGMLTGSALKDKVDSVLSVETEGDTVKVETLYDGVKTFPASDLLPDRCRNCKSKKHVTYDELIGEDGEVLDSGRFDEVEKLEKMTPDERFAFWQGELSRCIRCNACRDVCPACTCEKCVFDNPKSGLENKAAADSFEEKMFHIIRAFHVAGRCTDCGECSRVCPQHIPLHLLNRKFIKDMNTFYGEYQAGEVVGNRPPVVNYTKEDIEPSEAVKRGE